MKIEKTHNNFYSYYTTLDWRAKSGKCRECTNYHCCVFWWLKANHAHHLTYTNFRNEKFLRDIVPLSKLAHTIVHIPFLWQSRKKRRRVRYVVNLFLRLFCILCVLFFWIFGKKTIKSRQRRNTVV